MSSKLCATVIDFFLLHPVYSNFRVSGASGTSGSRGGLHARQMANRKHSRAIL